MYTNFKESFDVYRDTRVATVSYTHRFGDSQVAPSRRRVGGAEEEKQRAASGAQGQEDVICSISNLWLYLAVTNGLGFSDKRIWTLSLA